MFVNPSTFTVAQAALMSQVAELQALGHVQAPGTNFAHVHESMIHSALQGIQQGNVPVPAQGQWVTGYVNPLLSNPTRDPIDVACDVLEKARRFQPRVDPDFQPQQVIMQKGSELVPMIIEKRDFIGAREVLNARGRRELKPFEILADHPEMDLMAFLMRSWDGVVHALCVGAIVLFDEEKTFLCSRDVKFDHRKRTKLRDVGPVMTLARLLYMKNKGYWSDAAPVLMDIRPDVLARYRERLPKIPHTIARDEGSISRKEADYLIIGSPYQLVPLPISETTPTGSRLRGSKHGS